MMIDFTVLRRALAGTAGALVLSLGVASRGQETTETKPLIVCTAVPDLADLAHEIGGDQVQVESFTKGPQDPHFLEGRPAFIKSMSQADVWAHVGLDLEVGWAPVLLRECRNGRVQVGNPGFLDCSTAITPLDLPTGPVDRSMGDVHGFGNPHYLLDPLNGLKVAALMRDRFTQLRPAKKDYFAARYADFRKRLGIALVGEQLAAKHPDDFEKLALLQEKGKLKDFLTSVKQQDLLGGWLGKMMPYYGKKVVADHNLWPYFSRRFGLDMVGFLEPKPGLPPTTKHLGDLIDRMKQAGVGAIFAAPYFDPRHAKFVSDNTGAKVGEMAHQVGSRAGTDDYLAMIDYDVRQAASVLGGTP
jgi:ABC-type Zn uptake system ZnuABC Zn-binding protein ZnuA